MTFSKSSLLRVSKDLLIRDQEGFVDIYFSLSDTTFGKNRLACPIEENTGNEYGKILQSQFFTDQINLHRWFITIAQRLVFKIFQCLQTFFEYLSS